MNVMTTFLLNLLLLLGVVWMLLGIGYFSYQMWQSRGLKRKQSKAKKEVASVTSDVMSEEVAPHDLVGKSRPFVSLPIPEVPAVSSQPTPEGGRSTFVEAYATDGIGKANEADEIDEAEVICEDLSLSDDPLPELFTVTSAEYEAMHAAWHKAVKVLPDFTIVHKQDWFVKERYAGRLSDGELSFLARASECHFNERPFLDHACYLFLTKTTRQRMARQSNFSSLCRGTILPKEVGNREEVAKFMEAVDQFERIINDDDRIRLTRMTEEELVGTKEKSGLLDRYFSLSDTQGTPLHRPQ